MDYQETKFVAMWDMYGLETLINVTKLEQTAILAALNDQPVDYLKDIPLHHMRMRAQANMQRNYEIWLFASNISENDIRDMFEHSPQVVVDAIRACGVNFYRNSVDTDSVRIR